VFPGFVNNGNGLALGFCSFGVVTTRGIVNSSAYSCSANVCAFTLPVMSDTLTLYIKNDTGSSVNISNSWVYLVN